MRTRRKENLEENQKPEGETRESKQAPKQAPKQDQPARRSTGSPAASARTSPPSPNARRTSSWVEQPPGRQALASLVSMVPPEVLTVTDVISPTGHAQESVHEPLQRQFSWGLSPGRDEVSFTLSVPLGQSPPTPVAVAARCPFGVGMLVGYLRYFASTITGAYIQALPLTPSRVDLADADSDADAAPPGHPPRSPSCRRRILTLRVRKPRQPAWASNPSARTAWFLSLIFCRVLPGAVAALIVGLALGRGYSRPAVGATARAAVGPTGIARWDTHMELQRARASAARAGAAGDGGVAPALGLVAQLELRHLLEQVGEASRSLGCGATFLEAASKARLQTLQAQLAPLQPLRPCETDAIPNVPLAALGIAHAALQTCAHPLEAASADAQWHAVGVPGGFDAHLAWRCAQLVQTAYSAAPEEAVEEELAQLLEADLAGQGLKLVAEIIDESLSGHVLLARNESALVVTFRGSCNIQNVLTDLDYRDDPALSEAFAAQVSALPQGVRMHRGFVHAYSAMRGRILSEVRRELRGPSPPVDLITTGHSMGGALAMLCALDIASAAESGHLATVPRLRSYTFAAPRVGDAAFAEAFEGIFHTASDHWALQLGDDAVPHLPFAAWGFIHPDGVGLLPPAESGDSARDGLGFTRGGDPGDPESAFPRPGSWVDCHDIEEYMARLAVAIHGGPLPVVAPAV